MVRVRSVGDCRRTPVVDECHVNPKPKLKSIVLIHTRSIFLTVFVFSLAGYLLLSVVFDKTALTTYYNNEKPVNDSTRNEVIESCLCEKNPWSEEIVKFLNPQAKSWYVPENCKPKIEITQLIEFPEEKLMRLSIRQAYIGVYNCQYKCIYPKDDYHYKKGPWIAFRKPTQPKCDVFEVKCKRRHSTQNAQFRDLYYQIYRLPSKSRKKAKGYGVHMFIIDSTSHFNFVRALQRFTHLLREEYEAIPFPHLNKVGINSMPNAFAFLMGKQSEVMPASPINNATIKADKGFDFRSRCHMPLDDESSSLFHQFGNLGYKTMLAEDWGLGMFNWPHCTGYNKPAADHVFRPIPLRADIASRRKFVNPRACRQNYFRNYEVDHCREIHQMILDYFGSFINFYDDIQQKFSISWISKLTHDRSSDLYRADALLYDSFRKLKPKLENSFLFVMGDHGLRFGPQRKTEIGALEDNNPALFIALPKKLRKSSKLRDIMLENARHLISHHDLYATMLAIAKDGPNWDVANWDREWPKSDQRMSLPNMHGSSLLHYPMKQPRDCATLRIPFDYCQCPGKYIEVKDGELTQLLAVKSVEKLNQEIKIQEYSDICETLEIDENATVVLLELKTFSKEARNFKIQFQTQPGGGQFSTKMRMMENQKVEFTANRFERLNKHGHQSQCAYKNPTVAQLCYCKT